jgi:hypothetical protein
VSLEAHTGVRRCRDKSLLLLPEDPQGGLGTDINEQNSRGVGDVERDRGSVEDSAVGKRSHEASRDARGPECPGQRQPRVRRKGRAKTRRGVKVANVEIFGARRESVNAVSCDLACAIVLAAAAGEESEAHPVGASERGKASLTRRLRVGRPNSFNEVRVSHGRAIHLQDQCRYNPSLPPWKL